MIPRILRELVHATDGPLTQRLKRKSAGLGLGQVPLQFAPDSTTDMVCGFCATGCGLRVHMKQGKAVNLTPSPFYPVNKGMACPKGWEALAPLNAPNRATKPMLRQKGKQVPVSWEKASEVFVERFRNIMELHGRESVAFLSTGQIPTEEMAYLGSFFKFGMGGIHGDGNTRQCMATAATAYKQSFGFDAPPLSYSDLEESDLIILVGSNMVQAHPIMWERVTLNRRNPEIIVVDPRFTETAMAGTQHFAIKPKGDLAFLHALARLLLDRRAVDQRFVHNHTHGFLEYAKFLRKEIDLGNSIEQCGLSRKQLEDLADQIAEGKRTSFWWTMGVNQSHEGVRTAQAIINICLMTGNIGKPGTGPNSITGQCNAMGSRLFSNTTNLLGGHDFLKMEHRKKIADTLRIPIDCIPSQNSLAYDQILENVRDGKIKGLWVIATNTVHSWTDRNELDSILAKLDFIVVQDMYCDTLTAQKADLVLPAAGWGEKDGTFINSERRIGRIKQVRNPPGQARSDFKIFQTLAEAWGCAKYFEQWKNPEDVFRDLQKITYGQPCDITGISGYENLDERGGIQWPFKLGADSSQLEPERRLFENGAFYHYDQKARFIFSSSEPVPEETDVKFPLVLLSGRGSSSQWHTLTRSNSSAVLQKLSPTKIYVEIHPIDAKELRIQNGERVLLTTRRGEIFAKAVLTESVGIGRVFVPMHFSEVNKLTRTDVDPYSRQPSFKHCAVRLQRDPKLKS